MWDTAETRHGAHLPHDRSCPRCRHPVHTFLACSDSCPCEPPPVPGVCVAVRRLT
jgi:hypothetical protein